MVLGNPGVLGKSICQLPRGSCGTISLRPTLIHIGQHLANFFYQHVTGETEVWGGRRNFLLSAS